MARAFFALLLCLAISRETSGLTWTSSVDLPDYVTLQACPGQNVTLSWKYELSAGEQVIDVEWLYLSTEKGQETIASLVRGNFLTADTSTQHWRMHFLPNAGLMLQEVVPEDSGLYTVILNINSHGTIVSNLQVVQLKVTAPPLTDGELQIDMEPGAIKDNATDEWGIELTCGEFWTHNESSLQVVWTTPDNQTLPSTSVLNGTFSLHLPLPVASGWYTCQLGDTPDSRCLPPNSTFRHGAKFLLQEHTIQAALLTGTAGTCDAARSELDNLRQENENLTARLEEVTRREQRCCPHDKNYDFYSGRCLKYSTTGVSHVVAKQRCQADGAHLYYLKSFDHDHDPLWEIITAVYGPVGVKENIWLGADKPDGRDEYTWNDGTLLPANSTLWYPGEPNDLNHHENCVEVWTIFSNRVTLNDDDCTKDKPFVCEKPCE